VNPPAFPIVGIGASAGGLDAFHHFFSHMPADCGMAFVVILHLPAARKSMLTEILTRWTTMPVIEGADGVRVEPNRVYVPPPHSVVTLSDGRLRVDASAHDGAFRPIDAFFDALGTEVRERAVGIVLSGTGNDGTLGLKAIKACGGLTLAQGADGSAPQYSEMPEGAIATGAVDLVTSAEDMPAHLMRVWGTSPSMPLRDDSTETERLRQEICGILRAQLGHDFSDYRKQTFMRRVGRRMQVLNISSVEDYVRKLSNSPDEANMLFRDLLIRVTRFFRDEETFQTLETKVVPLLFAGKHADSTVRVWVPGCATGEEAYSLAILLCEFMDRMKGAPKVQIFATDIDEAAITAARLGRYPPGLLDGLSAERIERFFTLAHGSYVVSKEIRELCTFSVHSLVRDPPFSMMNLVSCRNLLIYMNPELQAKVIPVFHYALVPNGILLLGAAESVAQHAGLFSTVDKAARIFQKAGGRSPELRLHWQRPIPELSRAPTIATGNRYPALPSLTGGTKPAGDVQGPAGTAADRVSRAARYEALLGSVEPTSEVVGQLQGALATVCEELQALSGEYQTAMEELRSANEELHSVNEEMQSTNEELETSKEELQSLNEELHTVNMRLTEKITELDRSNSDLRNLFDSTEIATIFLDRHLIIRNFTPAIATLYNLIPSDQGRPLTDIVSRLQYQDLREDVAAVLSKREPLERRVVREGDSTHYIMRILPYRDPDNTVSGVLITFIDVTSIVQAEFALKEADARKDVFLATLSHELRNPLAPIRTAATILQSPGLKPDDLQRAQAIIGRQVAHMSTLLDDLLDVSRITRGSFLLKKAYVDLQTVMDEAVEAARPSLDRKEHELSVEQPALQITLEADEVRLVQVLSNLLGNAAKYTPRGGRISFGTRMDGNWLVLFVRDNGVGLAPEMTRKVFEMFTQVESQVARSEGGLGIGLALAKGLIELHGGRIEARSAGLNKGSEFLVFLPRSMIVKKPAVARGREEKIAGGNHVEKRVLIADDHHDGAEMMRLLLAQGGHDVCVAHCGADAIELAKREKPQIALLDIGMPDMNGYEVANRIRSEAWGSEITLIAVTGWGQDEDRRRSKAAGFDFHLTKPIDPEALIKLIESRNNA
jgi:two-component system CheB/CheR fusion protein